MPSSTTNGFLMIESPESKLFKALDDNHLVLARRMISTGQVAVNCVDPVHGTPVLLYAIKKHLNNMVAYLLANGHEKNGISTDRRGDTALMTAIKYANDHGMFLYLSQHPEAVNISNNRGDTALSMACRKGDTQIVQILLHLGANVNIQDQNGCTPLHHAASFGHLDIIKLLLQHHCKFTTKNNQGWTAADYCFSKEVARFLEDQAMEQYFEERDRHKQEYIQSHRVSLLSKREE